MRAGWIATAALALAVGGCFLLASPSPRPATRLVLPLSLPPGTSPPPNQWTIAAVGDVLLHQPLHAQVLRSPMGHRSLWPQVEPWIQTADIAYANLEGPTAPGVALGGRVVPDPGPVFDRRVYSSYPMFNYHASLVPDLVAAGFDVVSTANNHALDRGAVGVDRTIDNLRTHGLAFTGTRRSDEPAANWYVVLDRPGLRTAWLACSFSTNGLPDRARQVLDCYRDENQLLAQVSWLASRPDVDAVFVTPHWGNEYQPKPHPQQRRLAYALIDAGALAVLGSHPHVPQPWERHVAPDGHAGFIVYSMGNFVSGQFHRIPTRASLVVQLSLRRLASGSVVIDQVSYIPLEMTRPAGEYQVQPLPPDPAQGTPAIRRLLESLYGTSPFPARP